MRRGVSKLLLVLALGTVMAMPGIVSCKKNRPGGTSTHQIYPGPVYAGQNFHGAHAPLPGTLLLLGSGLAGLGLLRWKRRP
jgi:hypothetical protein